MTFITSTTVCPGCLAEVDLFTDFERAAAITSHVEPRWVPGETSTVGRGKYGIFFTHCPAVNVADETCNEVVFFTTTTTANPPQWWYGLAERIS